MFQRLDVMKKSLIPLSENIGQTKDDDKLKVDTLC